MSTSSITTEPAVGPCPNWCTLEDGHQWDSVDDYGLSRGHDGPEFGPFISAGAREHLHAPGVLAVDVHIYSDMELNLAGEVDAAVLKQLCVDAMEAALWLEAHQ